MSLYAWNFKYLQTYKNVIILTIVIIFCSCFILIINFITCNYNIIMITTDGILPVHMFISLNWFVQGWDALLQLCLEIIHQIQILTKTLLVKWSGNRFMVFYKFFASWWPIHSYCFFISCDKQTFLSILPQLSKL